MASLLRLTRGEVAFAPEARVIRAADYAAWIEGAAFLEAAKAQAAEIARQAGAAYEAEKARGYADGRAEAAAAAAEHQIEAVAKLVDWLDRVETQMADLVVQATEKILGALDDEELLKRVVHNALKVMRTQRQVTLRVAPEMVGTVQRHLVEIMAGYEGVTFVDVSPDARLGRGGCILESELGIVDASVEVQLAALRRALQRAFHREV
jgi:type III secretion protein L